MSRRFRSCPGKGESRPRSRVCCIAADLLAVLIAVFVVFAPFASMVSAQTQPRVLPGLDVLRAVGSHGAAGLSPETQRIYDSLKGRRLGIITNHTGRALDGTSILSVFRDELELNVVALFSPEHGFDGMVAAGDLVDDGRVGLGVPVFSLYGETRVPTLDMLRGLDTLVFDIQDIGVRFFTYISTMYHCLESASRHDLDFVVLDRPNPLGGQKIQGPILRDGFDSFVGIAPIPLQHGMTVGELARWFGRGFSAPSSGSRLDVVRIEGWSRPMRWPELGLAWNPASPNIRSFETAMAYPGLGLIEGTNVSEGRGIEDTFVSVGAPWIDGATLAEALEAKEVPGVRFDSIRFTPRAIPAAPRPKYKDEECQGVRLELIDLDQFEPVLAGLLVLETIRELYPDDFEFLPPGQSTGRPHIDLLSGSDAVRNAIESGKPVRELWEELKTEAEAFRRVREELLLY